MGIQVEKFENSHIHGSRSFRVFIRAILANVLQLFATLDIYYSQHFRNFAVLHTNESSPLVDTHLVETIRVHLEYFFAMFNVFAD